MAEKQGPPPPYNYQPGGAYPQSVSKQGPPPPYNYMYQPGGAYPQSNTTVIIQQQRPKPQVNHGLLGSLGRELDSFGRSLQKEMDRAGNMVTNEWKKYDTGPILGNFMTNNQIQLISKASGRSLQIVQAPNGQLVVDGMGGLGPQCFNAIWTVVAEGNNQVRLHNNNNYLTIANGQTCLIQMPPGAQHGIETKFQLGLKGQHNNFINLEAMTLKEKGRHIGVLNDGTLKPAMATGGSEDHAQFAVSLISSPYPPTVQQGKK